MAQKRVVKKKNNQIVDVVRPVTKQVASTTHVVVEHTQEVVAKFGEFLSSRSVLPLAVGLIVADTVKQLVAVIVDGLLRPLIGLFVPTNTNFEPLNVAIGGVVFKFGDLLSALLQAFIIFVLMYFLFAKILKKEQVLIKKTQKK